MTGNSVVSRRMRQGARTPAPSSAPRAIVCLHRHDCLFHSSLASSCECAPPASQPRVARLGRRAGRWPHLHGFEVVTRQAAPISRLTNSRHPRASFPQRSALAMCFPLSTELESWSSPGPARCRTCGWDGPPAPRVNPCSSRAATARKGSRDEVAISSSPNQVCRAVIARYSGALVVDESQAYPVLGGRDTTTHPGMLLRRQQADAVSRQRLRRRNAVEFPQYLP